MAIHKYNFQKRDFLYGGIITCIIGGLALVLAMIGLTTGAFDPIGQALNNYHISDGFFYARALNQRDSEVLNPGIVLVDIKDCDSRKEIAEIVNRVNESQPRLLAVDIIFGKASSTICDSDSALVSAFKASHNLILAQRVLDGPEGYTIERSFFADDVECVEGEVSFENGTVRSISPSISIQGDDYPTFISQIAKVGGITDIFKHQLINFSPIKNVRFDPENLPPDDLLRDQIVIMGDSQDLRDFHDIPVLMDGQAKTSGMNIIAQGLYTLRPDNGFTNCPEWLAILIGILLTYLFCTFIASPMFRIGEFNGLWISIWQVIALLFLLMLTFFIFWTLHFNLSLTYWLIGVSLSGLATEFFYFVMPKKNKR